VKAALARSYAPLSSGPLASAIRALASFARHVPTRELFRLPSSRGDLRAETHNEWTLLLFAWHESQRISAKTKRPLKASSVAARVSLVKGFLSHQYGFQIAGDAGRLRTLIKHMRLQDPLGASRRKRVGLRRRHLRKVWKLHADVRGSSFAALNRWAAVSTSWHVLARGGELKAVKRSDLTFHTSKEGKRYAQLMWQPLKKKSGSLQPKVPQYIAEQPGEAWQPYLALRRLASADVWGEGGEDEHLFRSTPTRPISTAMMRSLIKELAAKLGLPEALFGAQSARIGGATDLVSTGGASELLLQAKGRWASDIGRIYARMTRKAHLAASSLMFEAKGRDLEELLPEFAQQA